jgi:outer membrane receptor for ferrienterochelin and colicin
MRATYCMSADHKWPYTIAMILGGSTPGIDCAAPATPVASDSIEEVTVTAQRRSENIQDVPIAIQALTSETLTQLNVQTFDDLVKYLPNVSLKTNGPGQGIIYMRGLSAGGSAGSQSSGSIGVFPNVAIYLDDQSGQLPGRNLDIYAADLERIEVLEGPQGTLFGAGAQAGVIRYITNKPKLDATDSNFTAGYSTTAHGAANSNVTAMLNIPVIANTLAVRAVIYDDSRGGYIEQCARHLHSQSERSRDSICQLCDRLHRWCAQRCRAMCGRGEQSNGVRRTPRYQCDQQRIFGRRRHQSSHVSRHSCVGALPDQR